MKLTAVDEPRDDLAHVEGKLRILVDDARDFFDRIERIFDGFDVPIHVLGPIKVIHDVTDFLISLALFVGEIVRNARLLGVYLRASEFVGVDDFVQRGLDDRRPAQIDAADVLDDDDVVG